MRFVVNGVDERNGSDRRLEVDACDPNEAATIARRAGIFSTNVSLAREEDTPTPPPIAKEQTVTADNQHSSALSQASAGCFLMSLFTVVTIWYCSGMVSQPSGSPRDSYRSVDPTVSEAERRVDAFERERQIENEMMSESGRRELMPHVSPAERRRILPTVPLP